MQVAGELRQYSNNRGGLAGHSSNKGPEVDVELQGNYFGRGTVSRHTGLVDQPAFGFRG